MTLLIQNLSPKGGERVPRLLCHLTWRGAKTVTFLIGEEVSEELTDFLKESMAKPIGMVEKHPFQVRELELGPSKIDMPMHFLVQKGVSHLINGYLRCK